MKFVKFIENFRRRRTLLEDHVGFKLDVVLHQALRARDVYTDEHSRRVIKLAELIGRELGLEEHDMEILSLAAGLHDIGKIGVPDQILLKPGRLTNDEYNSIKVHPQIGSSILRSVGDPLLDQVAHCVLHHHEHWDGSGYPDQLAGKDIPLLSRIIAVVDAYDAMTSTRAYRKDLGQEHALQVIREASGSQFCPDVVALLITLCESGEPLNLD